MFIVFEGPDGCGKSTQARKLVSWLRERFVYSELIALPSPGPIGELLRRLLTRAEKLHIGDALEKARTMAMLFAADLREYHARVIAPSLANTCILVADRYDLSRVIYQFVSGTSEHGGDYLPRGDYLKWLQELSADLIRPDHTIILQVSEDERAARRQLRGTAELFDDTQTQQRVAQMYESAQALVPNDHIIYVDGTGDEEIVARRVRKAIIIANNPLHKTLRATQ